MDCDDPYFVCSFPVRFHEVDTHSRLKVEELLHLLQESASSHYEAQAHSYEEMKARQEYWVLARLAVRIDRFPKWKERLAVRTWAREPVGLFAMREFVLENEAVTYGRASSAWILLKGESRRPQRPQPLMSLFPKVPAQPPLNELIDDLEPPSATPDAAFPPFLPKYGDLDPNGHVNNARSVAWALASHTLDFGESYEPSALEIHYGAEIFPSDELILQRWSIGESAESPIFFYRISRPTDGKSVLKVRIGYRRR